MRPTHPHRSHTSSRLPSRRSPLQNPSAKADRPITLLAIWSLVIGICASATTPAAEPLSVVPEVQTAEWAQPWWLPRHEAKLDEAAERAAEIDLVFIGDSITHGFDEELWKTHFAPYGALNLGFSGDRTEQVLWRIEHGALDGLAPKAVVLMIGTNNTGHRQDPAAETALGIERIIEEIRQRLPDAQLLVLGIFPRGRQPDDPLRQLNEEINQLLPDIAARHGAEYLNINKAFLDRQGVLHRNVMPDLLHPNKLGYQLWTQAMLPHLKKLMNETPTPAPLSSQVELWPQGIPQPHDPSLQETEERGNNTTRISNVDTPSLSLFLLEKEQPAPAVLVCPGGGYSILAWDKEGTEVAQWLNGIGYSAAVLKYRVPRNRLGALQDAQRALGLLRHKAAAWKIDPSRIGVLGFSAGGHLAASLSNRWQERAYPPADPADQASCRPDFTILVYPAYLADDSLALTADFQISGQTPPAFIVQTQDDAKHVPSAIAYYTALHQAGIPAEIHLFPHGGHGYGLRPTPYPVSQWPTLCQTWLLRLP